MSRLGFKDQYPCFAGGSESPTRGSSIPCWSGSTVLLARSPGQSVTFFVRNLMPLKFLSLATIFWYSTTPTATPQLKGKNTNVYFLIVPGYMCGWIYMWVCSVPHREVLSASWDRRYSHSETYPSPHFPVNLFAWELFKQVSCSNAALCEIFTNRALRSFKKH